ncbi:MAG: single-stranded DNA-binding protein [Magnetococcales bacterium]|nr:single-stranded DNA-binding protein [Magnetococcales bacterium]
MASQPPDSGQVIPENRAVVEGVLLEPVRLRNTPRGTLVAELVLAHAREVSDLPPITRCELQMTVVAVGSLAEACRNWAPGIPLRVSGRLNQRRWIRDGRTRWGPVELVAQTLATGTLGVDRSAPPAEQSGRACQSEETQDGQE